jgi:uncharacterized membrane protein (UPF0127 family)
MGLLRNATSGAIIATRVERATSFLERTVGLRARSRIRPDEGLWFDRCSAINTLGMQMPIDVIFVDAEDVVVLLCPQVRVGLWSLVCRAASSAIELGSGALREVDVIPGDRLELVSAAS